jgi:hypothetical protein
MPLMKRLIPLLLVFALIQLALPQAQPKASPTPTPVTSSAPPATKAGPCGPDYYRNVNGMCVHRPVQTQSGVVPKGATAQCRDGSYSFSQHRRGTCNHHGGVAKWL